jgi:hypothetical protein
VAKRIKPWTLPFKWRCGQLGRARWRGVQWGRDRWRGGQWGRYMWRGGQWGRDRWRGGPALRFVSDSPSASKNFIVASRL